MSTGQKSVFGARLKEARLRVGLSQKQLGIQAGLDPFVASTRVNRYELGIHKVDYPFAQRLAKQLDIPVSYLYADDPELAELIAAYGCSAEEGKKALLTLARSLVSP